MKRTRMKATKNAKAKEQRHIDRMAELRPLVFARAGWTCEVRSEGCGGSYWLQSHHRLPIGDGGPDTMENLVAVCQNCHTASPKAIHRNIAWAREAGLLIASWEGPPTLAWGETPDPLPRFGF